MTAVTPARVQLAGWGWKYMGRLRPAVSDLTFTIEQGERVLLLGASGAGKSTLLAGLAGVLGGVEDGVGQGSLRVNGASPSSQRGQVGLVSQDPDAGIVLSEVGDDVAFGCENLAVPADDIPARVTEALDAVRLDVPLDHKTKELSGGQKQRLVLAGVLAMRPGLLLLDEPTANLDPQGVRDVRDTVRRVVEDTGATLLLVEHRTEVWLDFLTRVIVLAADGGLLADGSPERVFAEHGDALADAGVWVPDRPSGLPDAAPDLGHPDILTTHRLAIGRDAKQALHTELDLRIPRAAGTVITGPNGAGKSTLALTLAGLLPEVAGEVRASAELMAKNRMRPSQWRSTELLTRIGTVFQEPEHQFLTSTLREELAVGPRALGWSDAEIGRVVDELLTRLKLDHLALAHPFTLSGGQKRRLSVATVLASSPAVLVLDEPTFGQDRRGWIDVVSLMQEHVLQGSTVIAVSHDAAVAEHVGTQHIALTAPVIAERGGG